MTGLAIREVADRTGLAPGTIRMWEQRYGFPDPQRTASGYRRYREEDVDVLRRAVGLRGQGMSVPTALAQARATARSPTDHPSIYGAILASDTAPVRPRPLHKRSLLAISRAMEDEALARAAAPVCFAAFQHERFYRPVEHRYRRLAERADAAGVFADLAAPARPPVGPVGRPTPPGAPPGNGWAVIVDAPGFAASLVAWEQPRPDDDEGDLERRFEAVWTLDPETVRRTAQVAVALA